MRTMRPIIRMEATPLFMTWKSHNMMVKAAMANTDCAGPERPVGVGNARMEAPTRTAEHIPIHLDFFIEYPLYRWPNIVAVRCFVRKLPPPGAHRLAWATDREYLNCRRPNGKKKHYYDAGRRYRQDPPA